MKEYYMLGVIIVNEICNFYFKQYVVDECYLRIKRV